MKKILATLIGIAVFGFLMAFREEIPSVWIRALIAAAAGGVMGAVLILARKA
jgi:hypothetical protein